MKELRSTRPKLDVVMEYWHKIRELNRKGHIKEDVRRFFKSCYWFLPFFSHQSGPESIELFVDAFSRSYDVAPRPPPLPSLSSTGDTQED
jgi:hypothetical protein